MQKKEKEFTTNVNSAIEEFTTSRSDKLEEISAEWQATKQRLEAEVKQNTETNDSETKRLINELEELESRIRSSIERATGYTLFHSFQKRQLDLAESKRFWAYTLAVAVGVSLLASAIFVWNLRYVQVYNAAFYMKLSISLPLIYAIAFCSLQYSRERRLEEEYAFKSSISISLEPYQKLVRQLVSEDKPEEMAKYTAFIIDSVNRVFTSPTEHIFDDAKRDKNSTEKLIKALGEFIDPLVKVIRTK